MGNVVDLDRVRRALARLDAAVEAHPELTAPEAQERLRAALATASEPGEADEDAAPASGVRARGG